MDMSNTPFVCLYIFSERSYKYAVSSETTASPFWFNLYTSLFSFPVDNIPSSRLISVSALSTASDACSPYAVTVIYVSIANISRLCFSSLDFSEFSLLESSFLSVCVCVVLADAVLFPQPMVPIDTAAHKMAITIFLFILYPLYL